MCYSPSQTFPDNEGNLTIIGLKGIYRLNTNTMTLKKLVEGFPSQNPRFRTVIQDQTGHVLFSIGKKIYQLFKWWEIERVLWIGFLKNEPEDCLIAKLPAEIVIKISQYSKRANTHAM